MNRIKNSTAGVLHFLPYVLLNLSLMTILACDQQKVPDNKAKPAVQPVAGYNPYQDADISVEVYKVDSIEHNGSRGWGYDIMVDGKIYIHQPNIPAIMGNSGFSSEEKAIAAGEFVISKIKNNILPPSVTPEELDSLGVLD
jgi:Domain of unknown function (DUF4907)